MTDSVSYEDGRIQITCNGSTVHIAPIEILMVDDCQMADEIFHGDEAFYLVHLSDQFWLIGPFVQGAPWAVDALLAEHPELKRRRVTLERLPWRMRSSGVFGLRLWPVARLGCFPNSDLPSLRLREVNHG